MASRPGWVLVASGDAVRRLRLFRMLEREGHRATVVDDGHAALAMLGGEPFDLVLVDVSDPGLDAAQLLAAMRADPRLRHMPVLVTGIEGGADPAALLGSVDGVVVEEPEAGLLAHRVRWCLAPGRLVHDAERRPTEPGGGS